MDNAADTIRDLALQIEKINETGYNQYLLVASELCNRIATLDEVEHVLDSMLDFCGNDAVLRLFKNICRHYYKIYPEMIAYEINSYREFWDSDR